MVYKVGDRLQISSELCIIRFIGTISDWGEDITAYGLEWDNIERGRHDGEVNGTRYFSTLTGNSATIMKESKLLQSLDADRTLLHALNTKYGDNLRSIETMYIGSKKLESYGFDKLAQIYNDYSNLKLLSLSRLCVRSAGSSEELAELSERCTSVESLDLSFNLLTDFNEVVTIVSKLPTIRQLDVSGNVFQMNYSEQVVCPNLKSLTLVYCRLTAEFIKLIMRSFPNLESLNVQDNNINCLDEVTVPRSLRELNISQNGIKKLPPTFSSAFITTLLVAENEISDISLDTCDSIQRLDISKNKIDNWATLDKINLKFPNLKGLRIDENPFCSDESSETDSFYQIIARVSNITMLNGSILTRELREDAEFYFISKVQSGLISYDRLLHRWGSLMQHHNISEREASSETANFIANRICRIKVHTVDPLEFELNVLNSISVRYLKSLIAKHINADVLSVKLTYSIVPDIIISFNHEFSSISNFGISTGSNIYVTLDNVH
ncbi:Pac2p Ecym_4475 [Eremothecium cymbalariae DBVPG|uniref:CAP-Gly domain-containing protein n=1 Tax=Eremothecium cymbalariae (strain CBS 270.75 / DBVPG 7215 / KCTC 17166 / NRRL Y-17582) TaxID=931890 RepID=G8JU12_ERECY|nr:hypothetical protein Ecym_4475 [Eremothecium cymbalariae DBVPG\